ncbi:substrate-binding domain-containing protein [Salisediminibacterium beveridgei]|uniref:Phosphite/phosphonate ABC transporter, substrate binding protein, PBP2 superfamily n=1 Tax=Salisediminibacterium beveridgei TaxID=632773 RepID=A0A1D7QWU6_9BACI|nr:phosphate/phosphite/phosphonate ABC transporter substrate-binding protein [Salisediminibacterium beveridgei]AOM83494.1 phosphite/phosphonate ABC transporter, substrate binding protein, PBP2 superfamily [Salisediminibacterium beveridgei]
MGKILSSVMMLFIFLLAGCSNERDLDFITIKSEDVSEMSQEDIQIRDNHEDIVNIAFASVVSPKETKSKYELLVDYIEEELERPVNVIRKQTYDEVNQLLKNGEVDIGFICSLSYVLGREEGFLEGVATPVVNGEDMYRSYLIVNKNSDLYELEDLQGTRFAYMDPYSYSGRLAMLDLIEQKGFNRETFFKETFYTYSHDYSVNAVAKGAVDAASVDSILFDLLIENDNDYANEIRIIDKGSYAGAPPVVVSSQIDPELKGQFINIMLTLHENPEGKDILDQVQIDSYTGLKPSHYDPIADIVEKIGDF